jgi:hypothetical protein
MNRGFTKNSGFSIVELSIFLMIVVFFIILYNYASDKIVNYKIKQDISNIILYKNAVIDFKQKYQQLPGDLVNADKFFPDCKNSLGLNCNGNGDGYWQINESYIVFYELLQAKIIDQANFKNKSDFFPYIKTTEQNIVPAGYFSEPSNSYFKKIFFNYPFPSNSFLFYFDSNTATKTSILQKKIPVNIISYIDNKIDDGLASSGKIRASYDTYNIFFPNHPSEFCIDNKGTYKDDANLYYCSFIMQL